MKRGKDKIRYSGIILLCGAMLYSCKDSPEGKPSVLQNEIPASTADLSVVSLSPGTKVISSQETIKPEWITAADTVLLNGFISADERRDIAVSSRFGGRIEKLYVKYNYQYMKKGEKVMEIYSQEINTLRDEYLFLLRNKADSQLVRKTIEKARLLGISPDQLEKNKNGEAYYVATVFCPQDGYVYFGKGSPGLNTGDAVSLPAMQGMENQGTQKTSAGGNYGSSRIREGSYVETGQELFRVNDLKEVYGIILADDRFSFLVREGKRVQVVNGMDNSGRTTGRIGIVEPVFRSGQKFLSARISLENEKEHLKINSLITAELQTEPDSLLVIPRSSLLSTGRRNMVWVKTGSAGKGNAAFTLREITTGITRNRMTEVREGLQENEEVARHAGYLVDRESFVEQK